jgi:8-oxo-dGTP diphosphatase
MLRRSISGETSVVSEGRSLKVLALARRLSEHPPAGRSRAEAEMGNRSAPPVRKTASAIIIDPDGCFLLQQRDDVPDILYPGMVGLFGGHCEGNETFLECVVREVREEIGYFIPPERFEHLLERLGSDPNVEGGIIQRQVFVARDIPSQNLVITEGSLLIVRPDDLSGIEPNLAPSTRLALTALGSLVSE